MFILLTPQNLNSLKMSFQDDSDWKDLELFPWQVVGH